MVGSPLGGWLADIVRLRALGGRMMVQAIAAVCAAPFVFLCGSTAELKIAIAALTFWGLFKGFYDANIWASLFDVVPAEARGRAVGLMNMVGWLAAEPLPRDRISRADPGPGQRNRKRRLVYIAGALLLGTAALVFAPADVPRFGHDFWNRVSQNRIDSRKPERDWDILAQPMSKLTRPLAIVAVAFAFVPVRIQAQEVRASLSGIITDSSGAPVPGAAVLLTSVDRNTATQAATTRAATICSRSSLRVRTG